MLSDEAPPPRHCRNRNKIHIKLAFSGMACHAEDRKIVHGRRRKEPYAPLISASTPTATHDWFCCLMKQLDGQCKNETSIQVSQQPLTTVYNHNAGIVDDKSTKAARGHWMVEMIIGPFTSAIDAEKFKDHWMERSRGIISKRKFGIQLTADWRVTFPRLRCFDKRLVPVNYNAFLVLAGLKELFVSAHLLAVMKKRLIDYILN